MWRRLGALIIEEAAANAVAVAVAVADTDQSSGARSKKLSGAPIDLRLGRLRVGVVTVPGVAAHCVWGIHSMTDGSSGVTGRQPKPTFGLERGQEFSAIKA